MFNEIFQTEVSESMQRKQSETINGKVNVSKVVEDFLCEQIGEKFRQSDLVGALALPDREKAIHQKVTKLYQAGKLKRVSMGVYQVTEKILDRAELKKPGPKKGTKHKQPRVNKDIFETLESKQQSSHSLTPLGHQMHIKQQQVINAQPLDVGAMAQLMIDVDEQNKVYRNALEQIAQILHQAGIIIYSRNGG